MTTKPRIRIGTAITSSGRPGRIEAIQSFDDLLIRWDETGDLASVKRWDVAPASSALRSRTPQNASATELAKADRWFQACKAILDEVRPTVEQHRIAAEALGVSVATVYRAIARFRSGDGNALDFLAPSRRGRPQRKRLDQRLEAILTAVIDEHYLSRRRPTMTASYQVLQLRCRNAGLQSLTPHYNTFRRRVGAVSAWKRTSERLGPRVAREKMRAIRGTFPGADAPLSIVQIDHHLTDVEVVDETYRMPIGRPWVTVAIDVYSRMVVGVFLSLDSPSASSTGMCLINSMLPKEGFLRELGVDGRWPVWGKPRVIHADNGKDFRGEMLREACRQYGIETQFRPVRTPHFGGHIERLIGTIAGWFKDLPGATYSSPVERGEDGRGGRPAKTLRELEQWLVTYIVKVYHQRRHSALGQSPLAHWEAHFFGESGLRNQLPGEIQDEVRLRMTFMPMTRRTVQRYGLVIDHVHYMSDSLRHLIPAPGDRPKAYQVRVDPRDLSRVWLFDPAIGDYLEVPYRDVTRPAMSRWELRAVTKHLGKENREIDENSIFDALEELRRMESESIRKSKQARRNAARREEHREKTRLPVAMPSRSVRSTDKAPEDNIVQLPVRKVIQPFQVRLK